MQTRSLPTLTGMSLPLHDPVLQCMYITEQLGKQGIDLSHRVSVWLCMAAAVPEACFPLVCVVAESTCRLLMLASSSADTE